MNTEDLKVILKVAEFKSITQAAEQLDMSTATASAALKRVENLLGTELFTRTTRQLKLSSAGERYIPKCEEALQLLENAQKNIKDDLGVIDGEIRLAVSSDLGRNLVTPWLDEFMDVYNNVSVRINISDSNIDFYRDSIDIALRYGTPNDASMYGFKICDIPVCLCASPNYLKQYGTPKTIDDLKNRNGLFYQLQGIKHDIWTLGYKGKDCKVKMKGNRVSNDGDLVKHWCVEAKGLALKSGLDMSSELLSGNVISLKEFTGQSNELWLVIPSRQSITPTVRLLRDMLKEKTLQVLKNMREQGVI